GGRLPRRRARRARARPALPRLLPRGRFHRRRHRRPRLLERRDPSQRIRLRRHGGAVQRRRARGPARAQAPRRQRLKESPAMEPGHDPRVFGPDARQDAERELDGHVRARRERAGVHNEPPGPWALALSGGGIRSATFCLGLVRGLAGRGLLKHFDYLSTVSGGGYLGASLGRLYGGQAGAAEVEAGVARDHSMWLWWLRNNVRYLTPAGAKDLGYASASILRGVVATNLEIGVLIMALACLVLLPHFLVSLFPPFHEGTLWTHALASTMPSVWGWLLLAPLFACVHQVCAYWYTRDRPHPTS